MKRSINFIFPYNTWGGAFRSTFVLSNYLVERGWDVTITFPIIPPRNGYRFLSGKWIYSKLYGILRSLVRLNKIRMKCDANIVCVPWISSLWIKNSEFVVANHWNTIKDIYSLNLKCGKKIAYIRDIEEWAHYFNEELEAFKLPMYKICTTKWIKNHLKKKYDVEVNDIVTNGTYTEPFVLKAPKPPLKQICIGMCCASHPMKGMKLALKAIKNIKKKFPLVKILFFGYSKPDNRDFDEQYEWIHAPVGEDLRETYRRIHIFISASLQEGCHNPPREAMAAECAVVATNVGCIPDIAEHNLNALIVSPGSVNELEEAISRLICSPKLIKKLSREGKERILKDTWESKVLKFEKCLETI